MDATLLHDLMKLTFVSDEKHALNPLYPKPKTPEARVQIFERKTQQSKEAEQLRLEQSLDADIAHVLQSEDLDDHNADKKQQAPQLRRSSSAENLTSSHAPFLSRRASASAEVQELQQKIRHQLARLSADVDKAPNTVNTVQSLTKQMLARVTQSLAPESGITQSTSSDTVPIHAASTVPEHPATTSKLSSKSDTSISSKLDISETDLMQMASVQLGALKTLSVLLGCDHYVELLLIPKADLAPEKTALLEPSQKADDELQEAMRTIMKQMVKRAVMPSPIKRNVTLSDLERAQSVLYQMAVHRQAQDASGFSNTKDKFEELKEECQQQMDQSKTELQGAAPASLETSCSEVVIPRLDLLRDTSPTDIDTIEDELPPLPRRLQWQETAMVPSPRPPVPALRRPMSARWVPSHSSHG